MNRHQRRAARKQDDVSRCGPRPVDPKPSDVASLLSLGDSFCRLRKFEEAFQHYGRAYELRPDDANVLMHTGLVHIELGRLDEGIAFLERAIAADSALAYAHRTLAQARFMQKPSGEWVALCQQMEIHPLWPPVQVYSYYTHLAIGQWNAQNLQGVHQTLQILCTFRKQLANENDPIVHSFRAYTYLIDLLFRYRYFKHPPLREPGMPTIYLIGDSHTLCYANTQLKLGDVTYGVESRLVMGCKAWHLGRASPNYYKTVFQIALADIPAGSKCLVSIGEIDCRHNGGIIAHVRKHGGDLKTIAAETARGFVRYVADAMKTRGIEVFFLNVPAPCIAELRGFYKDFSDRDEEDLTTAVRFFNEALRQAIEESGCQCIDLYAISRDGHCHIDGHHLEPTALACAALR